MSGNCDPPKDTRFSSTNQPPNENKRGPKKKSIIKKMIMQEIEPMLRACIQRVKETGDTTALDKLLDRAVGKVEQKSKVKHDVHGSLNKMLQEDFLGSDTE